MRPGKPPDDYVPREGPEKTLFTKAIRSVMVRRAPMSLRSLVMALQCRPRLTVEVIMDLGSLIPNRNDGAPKVINGGVVVLKYKKPKGHNYHNNCQSQRGSLCRLDPW